MWKWQCVLLILGFIAASTCNPHLVIIREDNYDEITHNIIARAGSKLSLACTLEGLDGAHGNLVWGRRTKELWFENAADLTDLTKNGSKQILDLQHQNLHEINKATKVFEPLKVADRGTYFCMSLKYMLFKIIRIKVNAEVTCSEYQFKCDNGEKCINEREMCDQRFHCTDHSDEKWSLCKHLCESQGNIPCVDRCIPSKWCCDRSTDHNCFIAERNSCCPPLPIRPDLGSHSNYKDRDVNNNNNDDDIRTVGDPISAHKIALIIGIIVVLTMCIIGYFAAKECPRNSNNQNGVTMPSIIRTDDNDNTMILTSLGNTANNISSSQDYLDLPPTYDDSTRNSPQSSFHNSLEDIAIESVINDCSLPPSYDEALAKITSSPNSSRSNTPEPLPPFLEVPSVTPQRAATRDNI